MDRLTSMAAFVKAVELGSFAAAAAALDLSGPMAASMSGFSKSVLAYVSSAGPHAARALHGLGAPTMNAAGRFWPKRRLRTRLRRINSPIPAESYVSPCPCYSADAA
jgi:hypothetical protein